jgi:hypothetical protein
LITGATAVVLSLLIQFALLPRSAQSPAVATSTPPVIALSPPAVTAEPTPGPSAEPAATASAPVGDFDVLSQEIVDLRDENRQLWSALYLMRAVVQLGDAETALQNNELAEVERLLLTVRVSLDGAYTYSAEQEKGPIEAFRLDLGRISEDLRLRPEGLDRKLRDLRRLVLSLVDEGGTL